MMTDFLDSLYAILVTIFDFVGFPELISYTSESIIFVTVGLISSIIVLFQISMAMWSVVLNRIFKDDNEWEYYDDDDE